MDGWMDGWTDGRTDGRMDGWMDGWMDGNTESKSQERETYDETGIHLFDFSNYIISNFCVVCLCFIECLFHYVQLVLHMLHVCCLCTTGVAHVAYYMLSICRPTTGVVHVAYDMLSMYNRCCPCCMCVIYVQPVLFTLHIICCPCTTGVVHDAFVISMNNRPRCNLYVYDLTHFLHSPSYETVNCNYRALLNSNHGRVLGQSSKISSLR